MDTIFLKRYVQMYCQSDICLKTTRVYDGIVIRKIIPEALKMFKSLAGLSSNIFGSFSSCQ